jgi:hypothetical protein
MTEQKKNQSLETHDSFLEQTKNHLLAAIYQGHYEAVEQIYHDILKYAQANSNFSENAEKRLNQIQTLFKRFKPALLRHCSPKLKKYHDELKNLILSSGRHASRNIFHVNFQAWETKLDLNHRQKDLVYKTAMTFQLTSGCSNYCRRCNEWALPKVRSHFSHKAILKILKHMAEQGNDEICLYGASDPLDWGQDEKTLIDIIKAFEKSPMDYSLLTKVPKGKKNVLKQLLRNRANLSLSVTSKNKARIQKIEQELSCPISKQHDLDELLIPAGLDEDFMTIKPSITDAYGVEITQDGAFIIIPTFTSALHPFGHKKIRVNRDTIFFPVKKTGRKALLVDYFKPLKGYDLDKNIYCLKSLLDVQIESILLDNGSEKLTPPGMRSVKEYFFIFTERARLQRKKITPAVMRHLKKQFIVDNAFKKLSAKNKELYTKKIKAHVDLCRKSCCLVSKLSAISYFLESITDYLQKNPIKIKIIRFLLKDEIECNFAAYTNRFAKGPPKNLLADPDIDDFDIFRFYILCLVTCHKNTDILSFIHAHPSAYDPSADIFVMDSISH